MSFEKKSLLEKRRLTLEELEKYYMELRKYNFENNVPLKNIEARNGSGGAGACGETSSRCDDSGELGRIIKYFVVLDGTYYH